MGRDLWTALLYSVKTIRLSFGIVRDWIRVIQSGEKVRTQESEITIAAVFQIPMV